MTGASRFARARASPGGRIDSTTSVHCANAVSLSFTARPAARFALGGLRPARVTATWAPCWRRRCATPAPIIPGAITAMRIMRSSYYPASFMVGMLCFSMANQKGLAALKCLRIYLCHPGCESHFDEVELPTMKMSVHPDAAPFDVSVSYQASRVRLTRIPAGMREVAWHTVPEPNLTVRLDGSVEYETSDGEVRHVQAGSFVLVEDTHGKGHLSRHSAEAQTVIWISLPNGLNLPPV